MGVGWGVVTFVWLMITVVGGGGYLCMVDDDCVWAGMEGEGSYLCMVNDNRGGGGGGG